MDEVREYHRQRVRQALLRSASPGSGASHDCNQVINASLSAAERVLHIPELAHLILKLTPLRAWPSFCRVSKWCAQITLPIIWKTVSCRTNRTYTMIAPHFYKHIHLIQMLAFPGPRSSAISRFVEETAWIHELNLTSLNLRESGVTTEQLVWLLQHSPKLRSIDIVGCRSLEQHPLQTLHPYTHLEAIAFTYDDPFPASGRYPENVLGSWPALRHLNLSGYVLSKDRAAFPVFLSENTSLLNLKSLELVQLPEWADRALTKLIGSGNQLSSLSLTGCNFTPQELIDLSPSLHSLSSLTIRICSQIKTEHCLSILQSLPRIRHLDLGGCFTSDWFEEFVRIMPHIVSLTLTCDEISSAGLKQVFMNCRALRCQIIYTSLGPNSITTLFGGEPWNCLHLQELRLSGSDWSPAGWKDRSGMMKIMWSRLATLKRLRVLVLQNDIGTHQLKNELGVTQLGNLPQLELLCLTGFGIWHYKDVWWIAESLPELDRFCYAPKEMSTPLWSWLRLNRPDVWIIPLKTDAALG